MIFGRKQRAVNRILIVEDEPLIAYSNEYMVKDAGYEVVATVDTVADALRQIEEADGIDLVMADISLSDGSGVDVAEAARARGIAVLFVTGSCPSEVKHLAVGCLSKPYSDLVIRNALQAVDAVLRGEPPKRSPEQLTIFGEQAGSV